MPRLRMLDAEQSKSLHVGPKVHQKRNDVLCDPPVPRQASRVSAGRPEQCHEDNSKPLRLFCNRFAAGQEANAKYPACRSKQEHRPI